MDGDAVFANLGDLGLEPTSTLGQRAASYQDLVRVLLVVAAVIVLMLIATAIFGVQQTGSSYEIVPDPAGLGLPF